MELLLVLHVLNVELCYARAKQQWNYVTGVISARQCFSAFHPDCVWIPQWIINPYGTNVIYIYMEHPFLMFLDHTRWRSTVGRTPLDEWSARRRDLYLTTHDTHNRQISMPPVGFEPKISAGELPVTARLLRSWVRIPPGAWLFVCCERRVLSGRGLCDELITRPEESCRLCCVVVCDLETSRIGAPFIYDISSLRVNTNSF